MKTLFLFSIAAGIMLVVATYRGVDGAEHVRAVPAINDIVASVVSTGTRRLPDRGVHQHPQGARVAALIACVDVVIFTALATLGSFL